MSPQARLPARTPLELLQDQLDAVTAWQSAARRLELLQLVREDSGAPSGDLPEHMRGLRRANAALLARADAAVAQTLDVLSTRRARALVAHRQEWMRDKIASGLTALGVRVLEVVDDGADALGIAVAEQPELVVVEDQLPTISTADLVRSLRKYSPRTLVTAQVQSDRDVGRMLDAGASAVFSRRVPPAMLCEQVTAYLNDASEDVLLLT
jgi:CheY-like chemotaxis protein